MQLEYWLLKNQKKTNPSPSPSITATGQYCLRPLAVLGCVRAAVRVSRNQLHDDRQLLVLRRRRVPTDCQRHAQSKSLPSMR